MKARDRPGSPGFNGPTRRSDPKEPPRLPKADNVCYVKSKIEPGEGA